MDGFERSRTASERATVERRVAGHGRTTTDRGARTEGRLGDGRATTPSDAEGFSLGTTIVGVTTPEQVTLASDQRASMNGLVSSKGVQKIEPLGDGAALAYTGTVSAAQAVTARVRSDRRLYETRRGRRMSTEAVASVVGNAVAETPAPLRAVFAGVDDDGPRLYTFDGGGGQLEQPFAADGTGGATALGVLERGYEPGLTTLAARELAVESVVAASERDTASGNGVCVATIENEPVTVDTHDDPTAVEGYDEPSAVDAADDPAGGSAS